jgi:NAD-dependent epimerase/dehydratase family protein
MKIRAIVTGVTGMVGEGVLHECLLHPQVEAVLVINRQPCGVVHSKLKEIIHENFFDFSSIENMLHGYNACYFCLGVSSVGMDADKYYKLTYTLTMHVAETISKFSPDMTFCYVSGAHTDSTEKGKLGWARVKGKTENDLFKLPFKQVFAFRPSYIRPTKGLKNAHKFYKYIDWMYPFLRIAFRNSVCTLKELGLAMINVTINGYETKIIEGKDILALAKM